MRDLFVTVLCSLITKEDSPVWCLQDFPRSFDLPAELNQLAASTLVESGLIEKLRVKDLVLSLDLVVPWDRRLEPVFFKRDGSLWANRKIHFQDFGYLSEEDLYKYHMSIVAEVILAACRKFKLPVEAAQSLATRFPVTSTPYSPVDHRSSLESSQSQYPQDEELSDRELTFCTYDRANWCITPPLSPDQVAKIGSKTLNVCVPINTLPVNTFVEVANAMKRAPSAALRLQDSYFYSYLGLGCLKYFPHVRRVCLDYLDAHSLEELHNLSPNLIRLELDCSHTNYKPSLEILERFECLQSLTLRGHYEDLSRFPNLKSLRALSLRDVGIRTLSSIVCFEQLQSLNISDTKLESLSKLPRLNSLRYLCLSRTSQIVSMSEVANLANIEYLELGQLRNLQELPSLESLGKLRWLSLYGLKNFQKFEDVAKAPALKELMLFKMNHLRRQNLECLLDHPTFQELDTDNKILRDSLGLPGVLSGSIFKFGSMKQ